MCAYIPGPRRHSRSLAGIVLAIEELDTVELLGGRATGSPRTAAVWATQAPKNCNHVQVKCNYCIVLCIPGSIGLTGSVLGIVKYPLGFGSQHLATTNLMGLQEVF